MATQQQQIERLTLPVARLQAGSSPQPTSDKTDAVPASQQLAEVSNVGSSNPAPSGLNLQETTPRPLRTHWQSPVISIRFKGITITPGGFAEAAFRVVSRALGGRSAHTVQFADDARFAESACQSFRGLRCTLTECLGNVELSKRTSGDFLSAADTSSNTSTNSYSFRLRQARLGQIR